MCETPSETTCWAISREQTLLLVVGVPAGSLPVAPQEHLFPQTICLSAAPSRRDPGTSRHLPPLANERPSSPAQDVFLDGSTTDGTSESRSNSSVEILTPTAVGRGGDQLHGVSALPRAGCPLPTR